MQRGLVRVEDQHSDERRTPPIRETSGVLTILLVVAWPDGAIAWPSAGAVVADTRALAVPSP